MKELIKEVQSAMQAELARANEKFSQFCDDHQAYAVIKEELEESEEELDRTKEALESLWELVRTDLANGKADAYVRINHFATLCAAEAIQTAAMARKALLMQPKEERPFSRCLVISRESKGKTIIEAADEMCMKPWILPELESGDLGFVPDKATIKTLSEYYNVSIEDLKEMIRRQVKNCHGLSAEEPDNSQCVAIFRPGRKRIFVERVKRGESRSEAADNIGVSLSWLEKMESTDTHTLMVPRWVLKAVSEYYGVSASELQALKD